jgi:hypothetical protein
VCAQIAEAADVELFRSRPLHHQDVRVVETERRQPGQAKTLAKFSAHEREGCGGASCRRVDAQNVAQAGAGILGIEVDVAVAQRFEADVCSGEIQTALDAESRMAL